ncbi:MAG: 5'-methylthioadenosine/S-adenosylhomocysteine nucleosidase [Symploca sp. SIO2E6]|nr:5'-methylthioadenosine/S-adenosylhomocysteine nucleosidase [Symploca sp. SIO2E6]
MPRAVILTAISVEYRAVRANLKQLTRHPYRENYEQGTFSANGQVWDVRIAATGPGNILAALQTERAIACFNPDVILFVGVAGGIKDVRLGDVVCATKVYGYESGKVEKVNLPRANFGLSAFNLEEIARSEANSNDWINRLACLKKDAGTRGRGDTETREFSSLVVNQSLWESDSTPAVLVAPIASGEKVIASKESQVFKFLRTHYGDAVAVEMEGIGFLNATHANPQVSAMVIRGISDLIDGKSEADAQGYQEIAACHASAFAFEVLAKFIVRNRPFTLGKTILNLPLKKN